MGEASYLIKEIKQHCTVWKDTVLTLDVRYDNLGAIGLYERHGFKGSKVLPDKYGPGQDGIEMECSL
jgi:ribosomal protein S18 acetylase RimI-like enzyme